MTGIVERLCKLAAMLENMAPRTPNAGIAVAIKIDITTIREAADEIERLRAVLLEARVILQTWVNVSDDMSADPLPKPLREIQDDEQALLIRAQEWCRRMGPVTPAEATRFRAAADEIERLRAMVMALEQALASVEKIEVEQ